MRAATASIVHEDAYRAGRETAAELLDQLGGPPDVVIVFATSRHAPEKVLEGLWSRLPARTRLIGCSSFAEISADDALAGSVTAMALQLHRVDAALFKVDRVEGSSLEAGRALGERLRRFDPALVILLIDPLIASRARFVHGVREPLGERFPIMGGVASDHIEFARSFELLDREIVTGGAVALALRGPITFATVAKAGFQPVGVTRTCTKVEDERLILELDGASALDLYKEFLGPAVTQRPNIGLEFPLALVVNSGGDYMASDERSQVIRVVRYLDEARGALIVGGDVPEGSKVRMTRATKEDLVGAAVLACEEAKRALAAPGIGLFFNCGGRKLVLGGRYHREVREAFRVLGAGLPKIGFYTFGEIAPVDGVSMFHNETFTAVLIAAP
jgi:hypothetical protein